VIDEVITESTLDAEIALVDRAINVPSRADDKTTADTEIDTTTYPTIGTDGLDLVRR